jgi:hypothetical protein
MGGSAFFIVPGVATENGRHVRPEPSTEELEGLFRGELPRDQTREIVRHLLTGCPGCLQVTRRLWNLGEVPTRIAISPQGELRMTRQNSTAGEAEAAAQAQLKEIAEELKAIEKKLREIHKSLVPPEDARPEEVAESEADNDISTEIRSVIECVLTDSLGPAIRDLRAAARYGTKGSSDL